MSAGNLYRYFPSKEAIVEALCALDQEGNTDAFAELLRARTPTSRKADLRRLARPRFRQAAGEGAHDRRDLGRGGPQRPRRRDDAGARRRRARQARTRDRRRQGARASPRPSLDSRFAARFFFTFVAGLFKRIATEPDFDRTAETAMAYGVVQALFAGALAPGEEDFPAMTRILTLLAALLVLIGAGWGYARASALLRADAKGPRARPAGRRRVLPGADRLRSSRRADRAAAAARGHGRDRRAARIRRPPVRLRHADAARGGRGRGPDRRADDRRARRRGRRLGQGRTGAGPARPEPARRPARRERRGDQARRRRDRAGQEPRHAVRGAGAIRRERLRAGAETRRRRDVGLDRRAARDGDEDGRGPARRGQQRARRRRGRPQGPRRRAAGAFRAHRAHRRDGAGRGPRQPALGEARRDGLGRRRAAVPHHRRRRGRPRRRRAGAVADPLRQRHAGGRSACRAFPIPSAGRCG